MVKIQIKNSNNQILILEIEPILEQIEILQNESIEIICKEKFDLKIDIQKDNYISIDDSNIYIEIYKQNVILYKTSWMD